MRHSLVADGPDGGTVEAVQTVVNRTLPQALPEAASGASPSQRGVTRSLFNYLVPMLQDKRAEEEETEGEALGLST